MAPRPGAVADAQVRGRGPPSLRRAPPRQAKERPAVAAAVPPRLLGPGGHQRVTRSTAGKNLTSEHASPNNLHAALGSRPPARKRGRPPAASQNAVKKRPRRHGPGGVADPVAAERQARAAGLTRPAESEATSSRLAWSELPYMILVDVLSFAAHPLDSAASVRWLLAASTVCRSFAEPAVTALYRNPPLLDMPMAHGLADLLAMPPSATMFNYRQKVESLRIDVGSIASLTYRGRHLDVEGLVRHCPRLAQLDFFHQKDMSPYRELDDRLRWAYPPGLFKTLAGETPESPVAAPSEQQRSPILLRSWRWSARMMGPELTFAGIKSIHETRSFSTLRKVAFVNYQRPSLNLKNADDAAIVAMDKEHAAEFAGLTRVLPKLSHLVLESCTVANEYLLPLLPTTLEHLELINCWDVTADALSEFLVSHGHNLRHLTLHHNQSLSLSFLPLLGSCCPKLESLRMNLAYYKHHASYNDSKPLYDDLLLPDQVPAWPGSMQVVEIENMRKWTPAAAETFFQSFIDCAPALPDLRRISLKVMLDIPWRQRSAIREAWQLRLNRCFARRLTRPQPWKTLADVVPECEITKMKPHRSAKRRFSDESLGPSRRSGRISAQASGPSSRASSVARGLRRLDRGRVSYREPDSDEDVADLYGESAAEQEGGDDEIMADSDEKQAPLSEGRSDFVHGLCDVVDLRFDNQKPTEMQFGMEDFLDEPDELSDEDWDGDVDDDENYAW